jgi:hypothetical protein
MPEMFPGMTFEEWLEEQGVDVLDSSLSDYLEYEYQRSLVSEDEEVQVLTDLFGDAA